MVAHQYLPCIRLGYRSVVQFNRRTKIFCYRVAGKYPKPIAIFAGIQLRLVA